MSSQQIDDMEKRPWTRGSIILLHDGGGDRSATIAALPVLIEALRAHGYEIVPVSELVGKTRAEVMPPLTPQQRWQARADSIAFFFYGFFHNFVVGVFFVGDILMSAPADHHRRLRRHRPVPQEKELRHTGVSPQGRRADPGLQRREGHRPDDPLRDDVDLQEHPHHRDRRRLQDNTYEVARDAYPADIASGRLTVLTKPNGGKADALNYALERIDEEIYVGIDADGVIAHDAIANLVPHFANPKIGAVAGNAKVGNRVNLWTRWQALEYITSQNFERRALDLFDVVMVVPGAIGAWRTSASEGRRRLPLRTPSPKTPT